ncbi:hypothetical protein HYX18_02530 [Candidatus Woesearchaeota archaeon]|nr:hypothetical protein [Candidatus Woesearchaeota archaeon]
MELKDFKVKFGNIAVAVANKELDYMEKKERQELMNSLFSAYINDTYEKSTFFRNYLKKKKIDPKRISKPEDLKDIFLGKNTLAVISADDLLPDGYIQSFDNGLENKSYQLRIGKTFSSSGSTGRVAEVYYTKEDWDNSMAVIIRCMHHIPLKEWSRIFNGFHQGHVAGKVFEDAFNRAGALVKNRHFTSKEDTDSIKQIILNKSNALALPADTGKVSKGGDLKTLLSVDNENIIGKQIKVIITTGGPRPSYLIDQVHKRNELARVDFKTKFVDFAGCAEVLPTVAECEYNNGLHLIPGITYTEVINPKTMKHVKNNERGLLIYTGFKYGSRFIRYIVGDEATYVEEPCRCGRTTPKIKDIQRVIDIQRFEEGCGVWK